MKKGTYKKSVFYPSEIYPKCDIRHWESERYNRVYVLT